jgi:hypothetical protein
MLRVSIFNHVEIVRPSKKKIIESKYITYSKINHIFRIGFKTIFLGTFFSSCMELNPISAPPLASLRISLKTN